MKTSVELQEPISYMSIWLIIAIVLLVLVILAQIFFRLLFKGRLKRPKKLKVVKPKPKTLLEIKNKYFNKLYVIEQDVHGGRITVREGYQRISGCIRDFVFEATRIPVDKYSLAEIKKVGMPALTQLVTEYYEPEFARETFSDIYQSINKTRKVLQLWH